jgi:ABC-type Fe3+/spermidine/putrescine transport system ATPase subunit
MAAGLEVRDVRFAIGLNEILKGVSLAVAPGETVALLGPSGCGKTTLLRVVAGLERQSSGELRFDGEEITGLGPHRRGFGLMFQEHALFPHMNVRRNVEFGLRQAGWDAQRRNARVDELLRSVNLEEFGQRTPEGLSGGERQRVALARTLAPSPRMLMLDEPLGSLDRGLREHLVVELGDVLTRLEIPAIYVTHDQFEAFAIADRVAIMRAGLFVRVGTPTEVFADPKTEFVARFLGLDNILPGERDASGTVATTADTFETGIRGEPGPVRLLLREEGARVVEGLGNNVLSGVVEARLFQGPVSRLVVRASEAVFSFTFDSTVELPPSGAPVHIAIPNAQAVEADA